MQCNDTGRSEVSGDAPDERRKDTRTSSRAAPAGAESQEPPGIERGIADADKQARTGSKDEPVRNTPPAGAWNDTAAD